MQKMILARNRIWGNVVGGNDRSGYKELRQNTKGQFMADRYDFSRLKHMYPFMKEWERGIYIREKYQRRKIRIYMRGVKIGQKHTLKHMS